MTLQEKIFAELRRLNFEQGHIWRFQQYCNVFVQTLNPVEKREFPNVINELCDKGIFIEEPNGSVSIYRLTEKGEKALY